MARGLAFGFITGGLLVAFAAGAAARDLEPISILAPDPEETQSIRVLAAPPGPSAPADRLRDILEDGSLQPGDVVMFPDGPRVFIQPHGFTPWSKDDFEDVASSRTLTERQRRAILALTAPPTRLRVTISQAE